MRIHPLFLGCLASRNVGNGLLLSPTVRVCVCLFVCLCVCPGSIKGFKTKKKCLGPEQHILFQPINNTASGTLKDGQHLHWLLSSNINNLWPGSRTAPLRALLPFPLWPWLGWREGLWSDAPMGRGGGDGQEGNGLLNEHVTRGLRSERRERRGICCKNVRMLE